MNPTNYTCTICKKAVAYSGRLPDLYPFCSPRCRSVDLGIWFRGGYGIERELSPEELLEGDFGDTARRSTDQPPTRD